MADAPATPPAAPSTPPPAAPAPAPAPAPSAPTPSAPAPKADASPFSKIDERAKTVPKKAPAPPAEPKGGDTPPKEPPTEPAKVVAEQPKQLREKLQAATNERDAARKQAQQLEAKIAEYERKGYDTTALNERLAQREKELEDRQKELAAIRYERSDDFKKQYDKPFNEAANYAMTVIQGLSVSTPNGERQAKWDDFVGIYNLPHGQAVKVAKEMFGDAYNIVMAHFDNLKKMDYSRSLAVKEYEANADKRLAEERASQVQRSEKINNAWRATNEDILAAHPDWFGERPGDDEGNALLKESRALVEQAYTGRNKLTPEEQIVLDAHIFNRAVGFTRLLRDNEMLKAELEEYKEKLEGKRASKPGQTKSSAAAPAEKKEKGFFDELKEVLA